MTAKAKWTAGARGKPGVNADILDATEATRMVTDPDFEILGTNGSSDDVTFYAEGRITFTTDGADGAAEAKTLHVRSQAISRRLSWQV